MFQSEHEKLPDLNLCTIIVPIMHNDIEILDKKLPRPLASTEKKAIKRAKMLKMFNELEFYSSEGDAFRLHFEFFKNFSSHDTRRAYRSDLKLFFDFFRDAFRKTIRHPKQVKKVHIVAYKEYLSEIGGIDGDSAAPKTIGRKLGALNSYFRFLVEKDIIKYNPCDGVRRPRQVVKTETNALTDEQVRILLSSLENHTLVQSLHKAILYTLFGTGIRVSELINLKREDFGKHAGMKVIRFKAKGAKFRMIPLRHEVSKEIEHYLGKMIMIDRKHHKKDPLFQPTRNRHTGDLIKPLNRSTVFRIIRKYCESVEIFDRVSPHSARATLISSLLEQGEDLYRVSLAAGHENPKTTKMYDKRDKKLEDSAVLRLDYF